MEFLELITSQNPIFKWIKTTSKIFDIKQDKTQDALDDNNVVLHKHSTKIKIQKKFLSTQANGFQTQFFEHCREHLTLIASD